MSGLTLPGEVTDQGSALRYLRHDEGLKGYVAGQVELVVDKICTEGRSLREVVSLSEGIIREMRLLVSLAPLHRLTRFVGLFPAAILSSEVQCGCQLLKAANRVLR